MLQYGARELHVFLAEQSQGEEGRGRFQFFGIMSEDILGLLDNGVNAARVLLNKPIKKYAAKASN
jgi:hypothetical protein